MNPKPLHVAAAAAPTSAFDIPAAPILIPPGPWTPVPGGGATTPAGFRAAGMAAGLRAAGPKADLALVVADAPVAAGGVFTTNVMCAAPVTFCRTALAASSTATAVLINAGQANAATGAAGDADCAASAAGLAAALGIPPTQILLLSTGVIGRRIKMEPLLAALPTIVGQLGSTARDGLNAAVAVTTTDLVSKSAALEVDLGGGRTVRVGGFAKGSGMIHPNMATMLSLITTDAPVDPAYWRTLLSAGADASFNQISVDGDTSTNDTVIGLASGAAGGAAITGPASPGAPALAAAVTALLQGLAKSVAWDGEGATCLLECRATGAADARAARAVAKAVISSSLVKAAVFGHDPNWGRIACAAGYAGVDFDANDLAIDLGPVPLMKAGQPLDFDAGVASAYLKARCAEHGTVEVAVSLGSGPGEGVAWGCDLSYDYVKINAEYTT
jgi:glutamate N-acetyltransferase/amino-acid N-acetyltransferase